MKLCPVLVIAFLASCKIGPSPSAIYSAGAEQEVLRSEHAWVNSTTRKDADTFASFMHDSWVGLTEGRLVTKTEWANSIRAHTNRRDSVQLSKLKVRFPAPDVAVVTGSFMTSSRIGTATREHVTLGTYMNTWTRIGARWQLVSSGFTTLLKSP